MTDTTPPYADEIDVLTRHEFPFAREAPPGARPAAVYLLFTRKWKPLLLLDLAGRHADLRQLSRATGFSRLSRAPRAAVKDLFGLPPRRLSPMALGFYTFEPFTLAASYAAMCAPALGFAIGGGARIWLAPDALCDLIAALGFSFRIVDVANEIPEMALSHPEDSRGSATRRSPTSS